MINYIKIRIKIIYSIVQRNEPFLLRSKIRVNEIGPFCPPLPVFVLFSSTPLFAALNAVSADSPLLGPLSGERPRA